MNERTEMIHRRGIAGPIFLQRRPMRDYMPDADGKGNPPLWFAWRWLDDSDRSEREWFVCGVNTKREALAALDRMLAKEAA